MYVNSQHLASTECKSILTTTSLQLYRKNDMFPINDGEN